MPAFFVALDLLLRRASSFGVLISEITTDEAHPFEAIELEPDPQGNPCPREFEERVTIDVIHDGCVIPERFLNGQVSPEVQRAYTEERDWGAEAVAKSIASALHLPRYHRVNIARALLDFGRFPGVTPKLSDFMHRYAINQPFSQTLSHELKTELLERYYDRISVGMDEAIQGRLLKVAVHTYDEKNPTQTRRPAVSLLSRPHGWQTNLQFASGIFDPLFPNELAEFTCDRILRARIALTLEEAAIYVADNYPYALPEGSVEVRAQVWYFFQFIKTRFEALHGPTVLSAHGSPTPEAMVWNMLLDTNLRSTESGALRSYLHLFKKPSVRGESWYRAAREVYERIKAFLSASHKELIIEYRNSIDRPSALVLEVRKDLVFDFQRMQPRMEEARLLGRLIAKAITSYLTSDRAIKRAALAHRDPRFQ